MNREQYLQYVDHFNNMRYDDVTSYFTMLRVDRRFNDNLNTYAFWTWRRDDREPEGSPNTSTDEFRVFIGMRYDFDPVLF